MSALGMNKWTLVCSLAYGAGFGSGIELGGVLSLIQHRAELSGSEEPLDGRIPGGTLKADDPSSHGDTDDEKIGQYETTHAHDMHGMNDMGKNQTIREMQKFIERSPEGFGTLVLLGDSTMSGIVTEVMNVTREVELSLELVYVSNDRNKPIMEWKGDYNSTNGLNPNAPRGGVHPGEDWYDETKMDDNMVKLSIERARESTRKLHAKGCKSGGGIETYVFRRGDYKNLVIHHWGFLPEYAEMCWKPCMKEAVGALKAEAVVWNIGFHLLNHDFKKSICNRRHNPAKPGCGDYKSLVSTGTRQMLEAGVPTVIWKHTNWVCEKRQDEGFPQTTEALLKWKDLSQRSNLEKQCQVDCPQYKGMNCYDWHFNARTSQRMYFEATDALAEVREVYGNRVREIDTFKATKECCERGCEDETDDGEHYAGLDGQFALRVVSIANDALRRAENANN